MRVSHKKSNSVIAYVPKGYQEIFKSKYTGFIHALKNIENVEKYWTVKVRITFTELK